jgi:hypothetical protein
MGIASVDMRQRSIAHTFGRWPMAAQSSFASSKAMRLLKTSSGASAAHRPRLAAGAGAQTREAVIRARCAATLHLSEQ